MCGGGGGGGDGGAAARKAEEEDRVAAAIQGLNSTFGLNDPNAMKQRDDTYNTIKTDAVNKAMMDLNKDHEKSGREVNFMLARQGLSGGSADVDTNKQLSDTYQQGILQAANIGDSTANNARSNDEKTRVNLINSIRSGLDQGNAQQMAYTGMQNNVATAKNEAQNANMTGFFNTLMNGLQGYQYQQGVNQVVGQNQPVKSPYGGATDNYDGTIR